MKAMLSFHDGIDLAVDDRTRDARGVIVTATLFSIFLELFIFLIGRLVVLSTSTKK